MSISNKKTGSDGLWRIWIDTGGTFTDCIALDSKGKLYRAKVLSSSSLRGRVERIIDQNRIKVIIRWSAPSDLVVGSSLIFLNTPDNKYNAVEFDPDKNTILLDRAIKVQEKNIKNCSFEIQFNEEAPVLVSKMITNTSAQESLPPALIRLATTRGTNALLERKGGDVALFITKGFGDLLVIGNQQRPDLFELKIEKPRPLYKSIVEIDERVGCDGKIIKDLNLEDFDDKISDLLRSGIDIGAVVFMNSYANPIHEEKFAQYLLSKGFRHVSCSSELVPFMRILPRAETTVVNSYLVPVIKDYLQRVTKTVDRGHLHVMTSAGGLVKAESYHAKDSLLSGPAGGVVGAVKAARYSGFEKIISFDMGGTSTDVARFDGDYDYVFEHIVGDAHLVAPALAIESVAAGGGSVCQYKNMELQVGPESGGADPGPACYGAGGPLTLTDVNLLLGRLDESRFEIPIDRGAAEDALERVIKSIKKARKRDIEKDRILEGFLTIACERMADAIRKISIRKGYDPKNYVLVAFGGAGAQHACSVAQRLNMDRVLIPVDASLLSAIGLGWAVIERFCEKQIIKPLHEIEPEIDNYLKKLEDEAIRLLRDEGIGRGIIRRRILNLRFIGQDSVVQIEYNKDVCVKKSFEEKYRSIFGHWPEGRQIELESIRVVASSTAEKSRLREKNIESFQPEPDGYKKTYFGTTFKDVPFYERKNLRPGANINGPALIFEPHTVTVVEEGWDVVVDHTLSLLLRKKMMKDVQFKDSKSELVRLELFTNRFCSIAEEMGEMLRRMAISTNVKDRLDFSCGILDKNGRLVVNAPHIPVHLGSMGLCVRSLIEEMKIGPSDVVVTNHPRYGGSHLPDVSVIMPVYTDKGELIGFVGNRCHHAEIGGALPGSMPPTASSLAEEGVVIPPTFIIKNGKANWDAIRNLLQSGPYPSRAVEENIADLKAAVAANISGANALLKLACEVGADTVDHYMKEIEKRAESRIKNALKNIPDGTYMATERLDDGSPLMVRIEIIGDRIDIDFTGSAKVHPKNLNGTPAIVNSVVIYVLRLLLSEPLPLNEGLMNVVNLHIPEGILNPPFPDDPRKAPAVVGGNVETSQRLVDTLIKALGIAACSQGTMNNVLFGNENFSYYETVCGGCGAGKDFHGSSAVHSHMTNTRITDPEIVEHRYPVRLKRFSIRKGSGGEGRYRGGDGVIREIEFLDKMYLSVLGQHRKEGPYGMKGGENGEPAKQTIIRKSGEKILLDSIDSCEVRSGDRFILETPGGGGWGKK